MRDLLIDGVDILVWCKSYLVFDVFFQLMGCPVKASSPAAADHLISLTQPNLSHLTGPTLTLYPRSHKQVAQPSHPRNHLARVPQTPPAP
jgi:hypothetical protein